MYTGQVAVMRRFRMAITLTILWTGFCIIRTEIIATTTGSWKS